MKPIFNETTSLDKELITKYSLTEDIMMENAATALMHSVNKVVNKLCKTDDKKSITCGKILIICGSGDNGGDGYALARKINSLKVIVYSVKEAKSNMCKKQYERAVLAKVKIYHSLQEIENIFDFDVMVDCFLGTGFVEPLSYEAHSVIDFMNNLNCYKISCDVPSGNMVECDEVITMGALKTSLFTDKIKTRIGKITCADLGVSSEYYQINGSPVAYLLEESNLSLPHRKDENVNKGNFGHSVFFSGDKLGASVIAASAAIGFGSGLVSIFNEQNLDGKIPYEIMYTNQIPNNVSAIGIGMGLGSYEQNKEKYTKITEYLIQNKLLKTVLDADFCYYPGLTEILETRKTENLNEMSLVLTPHPKEFCSILHLCGYGQISVADLVNDRLSIVKEFTNKYSGIVLLLKGSNTITGCKYKGLYINNLGTNCLAKAGSGDVLSGLIVALLAQGYNAFDSTIQANLAHTIASRKIKTDYGMTPFDLIHEIKNL